MGRGLSPLQRTMLALALRNHDAEGRAFESRQGCDAYHAEVYIAAYGWTPRPLWRLREWVAPTKRGYDLHADPPAGQGNRAAVMAAVSRAAHRLQRRGLVRHVGNAWGGISLTPEGHELAKTLSVKPAVILPRDLTDTPAEPGPPAAARAPAARYPPGTQTAVVVAPGGTFGGGPWRGGLTPRSRPDLLWTCDHEHGSFADAAACADRELAEARPYP